MQSRGPVSGLLCVFHVVTQSDCSVSDEILIQMAKLFEWYQLCDLIYSLVGHDFVTMERQQR